jgi:hypothetical protein
MQVTFWHTNQITGIKNGFADNARPFFGFYYQMSQILLPGTDILD